MTQTGQLNIIGKGVTIRGSLSGAGDVVVEGRVEGQVALKDRLTVDTAGTVEADVQANEIVVNGQAAGTLEGRSRVSVRATARVSGTLKAPSISIEDGARFDGTIEMDVKLPDGV